jgi:predicted ABC-type sugar transport system permease subunit
MLSIWTEHRSELAWTGLVLDLSTWPDAIRRVADMGAGGAFPVPVLVVIHLLIASVCIRMLRRRNPHREFVQ